MDSTTNKKDSYRITGAAAVLEFCKIVAFDLGFNTEDVYWTTDFTQKNKQHILTLITETSVLTVIEIGDQQLINYTQGIGAEIIRDKIRQGLSAQLTMLA